MLLNSVLSRRAGWTTALLLALSAAGATAGSLEPTAAPTNPASAMFTLTDLYLRLDAGTAGVPRPGAFVEPAAGPTAGTGYTLNQIMAAMPTLDDANGAGVADVLAAKTFWSLRSGAGVWGGPRTGTMTNRGAFNLTCGTGDQAVNAGYYSGGTLAGNSSLAAENIKSGVILFGVTGTYAGTTCTGTALAANVLDTKTFSNDVGIGLTGGMLDITTDQVSTAQGAEPGVITLTAPQGYYDGADKVTATDAQVAALDADITVANIKKDVTIFGVMGTYESVASPPCTCSNPAKVTNGRWCDNENGTVTDLLGATVNGKVQGRCLVWLKNAGWGGTKAWRVNAVDDHDDAHTRAGLLSASAGDKPADLSDGSVVGDWRLPTKTELQVLTTAPNPIRSTAMQAFTGVQPDYYWSSTTDDAAYTYDASNVNLDDGSVYYNSKLNGGYVWPVRGGL